MKMSRDVIHMGYMLASMPTLICIHTFVNIPTFYTDSAITKYFFAGMYFQSVTEL